MLLRELNKHLLWKYVWEDNNCENIYSNKCGYIKDGKDTDDLVLKMGLYDDINKDKDKSYLDICQNELKTMRVYEIIPKKLHL